MRIVSPESLHYPITVTRLLCKPRDQVERNAPLFDYQYRSAVLEGDEDNKEGRLVERTWPSTFESYVDGALTEWYIGEDRVIARPGVPICDIDEPCKHEVQFGGMCADCGKDMTTVTYSTVTRDTARATVNAVHGHTQLLVSRAEASKSDEEAKRRLLSTRKLSLVVDLDQTIIHATVDPTVAEWQRDPDNPNHPAVKDVRAFQLADDGPGARGCWYYIKLRPGLHDFLDTISKSFELHIYTMGTRAYAQHIASIVDPDRKIFADRILSRDESGSLTVKNLKRLFPVDTKMVVIIDDRGDVWHWSQNLIKVTPYDFFVGIGDINSSFLPKRPQLEARPAKTAAPDAPPAADPATPLPAPARPEPAANPDLSAIDQLVSMGGGNDPGKLKEQTSEQTETIAAQLADRPLLQKQKLLDAAEEESTGAVDVPPQGDEASDQDPSPEPHSKYRHNLLQDNDTELQYLQQSLQSIHSAFFDEYDRSPSSLQGGRVAELRPGPNRKHGFENLDSLPDVTAIMAAMKQKVLRGVSLVFSGVVPLGVAAQSHDLAIWAKSFGASVSENITKRTTHVIASPLRKTAKVRQAAKKPDRIKIVSQDWLFGCLSQWQRLDESPFRIHTDLENGEKTADAQGSPFDGPEQNAPLSSSDEEAALTEEEAETPNGFEHNTEPGPESREQAELEQHIPSLSREASSSHEETNADWDDMNDELADFLGSEAESDSEAESTRSTGQSEADGTPPGAKKRKRDDDAQTTDDKESDPGDAGSKLQKRKRKALARTTSLVSVAAAAAAESPASATSQTGAAPDEAEEEAEDGKEEHHDSVPSPEDDDADAALEAELEAEMLRQAQEDGDE